MMQFLPRLSFLILKQRLADDRKRIGIKICFPWFSTNVIISKVNDLDRMIRLLR